MGYKGYFQWQYSVQYICDLRNVRIRRFALYVRACILITSSLLYFSKDQYLRDVSSAILQSLLKLSLTMCSRKGSKLVASREPEATE